MTHETLQRRLLIFLWIYEVCIIAACLVGGGYIAMAQGGSLLMAAPLLLVAAAEMLRIPIAGVSTRLGLAGRTMAAVALIAIAVVSFEGLSMVFEGFLDNRTGAVLAAQRGVDKAQASLDIAEKQAAEIRANIDVAREKVVRLDSDIANKTKNQPQQPSVSSQPCTGKNGRRVTCASDAAARETFRLAQAEHLTTLRQLREDRKRAQEELDRASSVAVVDTTKRQAAVTTAKETLSDVMHVSPMHRLAASIMGVRVADLKEDEFERVKRWGVIGLSAAFATLSMFVSVVVHQSEHDGSESKLSRAIRATLARRRRKVIAIRTVEVPGPERVVEREVEVIREVPVRQTVIRHVPVDFKRGRHAQPPEREIVADRLNPIVTKLVGSNHEY